MRKRYSLNKIENQDKSPFDESEYSLFKFGDTYFARKFAKQLFVGFINEYKAEQIQGQYIRLNANESNSIFSKGEILILYLMIGVPP